MAALRSSDADMLRLSEFKVALDRRRFGHCTRHGAGPGWHDHGRIGVPCAGLPLDDVLFAGTIGREGGDWARGLIGQGSDLRCVIDAARH